MQAHPEFEAVAPLAANPRARDGSGAWRRQFGTKTNLGSWSASLVAALVLALVNAVAIRWWVPNNLDSSIRLRHHLLDAAQQVAFVCALASGVLSYERWLRPLAFRWASWRQKRWLSRWLAWAVLSSSLAVLLWLTLSDDFMGFAQRRTTPQAAPLVSSAMSSMCAVLLATGLVLLTRWWRGWLALGAAGAAVAMLLVNHRVLLHNYPGVHFYLALCGATTLIACLRPWRPWRGSPGLLRRVALSLLPLICLPVVLAEPSQTLQSEQMRVDGSVVASRVNLARHWLAQRFDSRTPFGSDEWLGARPRQPVPSRNSGLLPERPVVLMVTIDAVRADVLDNPEFVELLPHLSELKRRSIYFSKARSPGSQTVTSLSGMFSGLYFSQQYWSAHPKVGFLFLGDDPPPRFPELLQQAGVKTVTFSATYFLLNSFGVVRGFDEEKFLDNPGQHIADYSPGSQLTDAMLEVLEREGQGSLFLYAHFLDTHFPYKKGGRHGPPFTRYLKSIAYVDRQLGRLLRKLEQLGLRERTLILVASDHGEAFGEHNSRFHATTLYEEQLRVPLMFVLPGLSPRQVEDPVTLMDVGPTLLDLFGLTTPAHFMGQSLVPLFRGESVQFERPIVAEGRLKKALYFRDGFKLIVDDKHHTQELYDLKRDPKELRNLIDDPASDGPRRLRELREFFQAHQIQRPGYQIPYRP